jgi:uncharacterized protein
MNHEEKIIIEKTARHVKEVLGAEGTGHDWWHILRVWNNAKHIAQYEQVNLLVVELAALLHDIADWKFHSGDEHAGGRAAQTWLESLSVDKNIITQVIHIVDNLSFKGAAVAAANLSDEGRVVQDADRLDAIGAIGIARAFAYGGHKGRALYNPDEKPELHTSFEAYKRGEGSTINHFYEKLFLLKDRMHTNAAKELAAKRHAFMEQYIDEFLREWRGE